MRWPFGRRHAPEDAPAVVEAREKRDKAFKVLGEATEKVDEVTDRIMRDYQDAEDDLKQ